MILEVEWQMFKTAVASSAAPLSYGNDSVWRIMRILMVKNNLWWNQEMRDYIQANTAAEKA